MTGAIHPRASAHILKGRNGRCEKVHRKGEVLGKDRQCSVEMEK